VFPPYGDSWAELDASPLGPLTSRSTPQAPRRRAPHRLLLPQDRGSDLAQLVSLNSSSPLPVPTMGRADCKATQPYLGPMSPFVPLPPSSSGAGPSGAAGALRIGTGLLDGANFTMGAVGKFQGLPSSGKANPLGE
jgi:hypothetical protein